jgi:hypothetical protein
VHVLVLARAHLLPQPPQPCKESKSDAGVRPSPPGSTTSRPRLPYRSGELRSGTRRRARRAAPGARRGPTSNPSLASPADTAVTGPDSRRRNRGPVSSPRLLGPVASAPAICTHAGEGRASGGPPNAAQADLRARCTGCVWAVGFSSVGGVCGCVRFVNEGWRARARRR